MDKKYIFISYSKQNASFSEEIYSELENAGYRVWKDKMSIDVGAPWFEKISNGLADATVVLFLVSQDFVNSKYCCAEALYARLSKKKILPIFIDKVVLEKEFYDGLGGFQPIICDKDNMDEFWDTLLTAPVIQDCKDNNESQNVNMMHFSKAKYQYGMCVEKGTRCTGDIVVPRMADDTPVTEVMSFGFAKTQIKSIELPVGLKRIRTASFMCCLRLKKLVIPNTIDTIDPYAFLESGIESIRFPKGLKTIDDFVCLNCRKLTEVHIPSKVEKINKGAFMNCNRLKKVYIPESVKLIGKGAFECNSMDLKIFCEASEKPNDWDDGWCQQDAEIIWGFKDIQ